MEKTLTHYYTDNTIRDDFFTDELDDRESITFVYEQAFPFPNITILDPLGKEYNKANYSLNKLSDFSSKLTFNGRPDVGFYTFKIY
jgi:hypothetical protein